MGKLLEHWLDHLTTAGALIGDRQATAARLEGWMPWLQAAATADEAAKAELMRIVAIDARNLAEEGRPASVVVTQPLLLATAWPEGRALSHLLVRVAADAHALGAAGVRDAQQRKMLARRCPILRVGTRWLAFLIGPMDADIIDGVLGRLLQAGLGTTDVALDIAGADPANDVFFRTLEGFVTAETGTVHRLTITGTEDDRVAEWLSKANIPADRVSTRTLEAWMNAEPQ